MTRSDLHIHTTASDGRTPPHEVIAQALKLGLTCIAITDHDTTAGYEAIRHDQPAGLLILPGIELSAEDEGGDVHILGYCMDIDSSEFQDELSRFRDDRYHRGRRIVQRLGELGAPLDWERVQAIADGGSIGRPHIARALVEAGHVASIRDAFDRYIGSSKPAYVARRRMAPEEAIAMIQAAGGVAVMAHPALVPDYPAMIERLVRGGLDGVEVAHPTHTPEVELRTRMLADRHGLIISGGSDYHGDDGAAHAPIGSMNVPQGAVAALQARARERRQRA